MATKDKKMEFSFEEATKNLTERHILFCLLYAQDKNCFANASMSYAHAYNLTPRQALKFARQSGYQLLTNPYIKIYINKLLLGKFNNVDVDMEHSRLITQNKNLIAKLGAIQEYNKVKKRVDEAPVTKVTFQWKGDNRPKIVHEKAQKSQEAAKVTKTPKGKFKINI